MNENATFEGLAEYYDLVYSDKDYEKEIDFIEECFKRFHKSKKILEIGCGTGNCTKLFLERGYEIAGLDFSENMLKIARRKCACTFLKGDIRDISISDKFDSCLAMNNVIGYVTENPDIINVFRGIRQHLKNNGLFVFDVWNGLALMRTLPECRVKEMENAKLKVVRFARPTLKAFDHICEVDYKLVILRKDDNRFNEVDEKHIVRFFFPQEIKYYLENVGFRVLKICPILNLDGDVNENVWNMSIIAKAV